MWFDCIMKINKAIFFHWYSLQTLMPENYQVNDKLSWLQTPMFCSVMNLVVFYGLHKKLTFTMMFIGPSINEKFCFRNGGEYFLFCERHIKVWASTTTLPIKSFVSFGKTRRVYIYLLRYSLDEITISCNFKIYAPLF